MHAINRYRLLNLYGELLTGAKKLPDVDRELRAIIADEKAHSYDKGIQDTREGRWGE